MAPRTVQNVHAILHRALKDAMRWGYAARNVADAVDPPKGLPAERQVWTPEQLRAFLSHVRDDRLYAAWLLVATTGLRRAELAGLRWLDVDLADGADLRLVPAAHPRGRAAEDPAPRCPAQLRHRRAGGRRPAQGGQPAPRPRHDRDHDGHLQPRHSGAR
jgi:integrase